MKLIMPTMAYKEKAEGFIGEFREYGSEINGSGGLDRYLRTAGYEQWLEKLRRDMDAANMDPAKVPALTYFYVDEETDEIVGMVNIRLALNDFLRAEGGHIGYGVRPTKRGRHHATEMLRAALRVCDVFGIRDVIVTCDRDNPASAHVIMNCGGVLDDEFYSETFGEIIQRYIIRR